MKQCGIIYFYYIARIFECAAEESKKTNSNYIFVFCKILFTNITNMIVNVDGNIICILYTYLP